MAKIYKINGCLVSEEDNLKKFIEEYLTGYLPDGLLAEGDTWQQLQIEEIESSKLNTKNEKRKLIDADNFKRFCHEQLDKTLYTVDEILEMIDMQPTAYDVDKVVEELKQEIQNGTIKLETGNARLFEIVKHGGVETEDVCQWQKYDYKTICSPHERYWSIPAMKDFKWCPYCRKKIKVVE